MKEIQKNEKVENPKRSHTNSKYLARYKSKYGDMNNHEFAMKIVDNLTKFYSNNRDGRIRGRNDKLEIIGQSHKFKSLSPSPLGHFDHSSILLNFCDDEAKNKEMKKNIKAKKKINSTINRYYAQHFSNKNRRRNNRVKANSTVDARLNELEISEYLDKYKKRADVFLMK